MEYASVVIPTLNRDEHLKRCVTSLAENSMADRTVLVVSVDYPPAQKYEVGYRKVCDFLNADEDWKKRFAEVRVIFQEQNLGPAGNTSFLFQYAAGISNRMIYTEDDNEFALNFLEYMNACLEYFEQDERVMGICGCADVPWKRNNDSDNVAAIKFATGYGIGFWLNRDAKMWDDVKGFMMSDDLLNRHALKTLKTRNPVLFSLYMRCVVGSRKAPFWREGELFRTDSLRSMYLHMTDRYCVAPAICKSRTWGNDGSGVNMSEIVGLDTEERWPLDKEEKFELRINNKELTFEEENYSLGTEYLKTGKWKKELVKSELLYLLLQIHGFDIERTYQSMQKLRKLVGKG